MIPGLIKDVVDLIWAEMDVRILPRLCRVSQGWNQRIQAEEGYHQWKTICSTKDHRFDRSCALGYLRVVQSLWPDHRPQRIYFTYSHCANWKPDYWKDLFYDVCRKNHLKLAQWLWPRLQLNLSLDLTTFEFLISNSTCPGNHLQMLQWLYSLDPTRNRAQINRRLFTNCCENGKWEIARWLHQIEPTIDLHQQNNYILTVICYYGREESLRWLLSVWPTDSKGHFYLEYRLTNGKMHPDQESWSLSGH